MQVGNPGVLCRQKAPLWSGKRAPERRKRGVYHQFQGIQPLFQGEPPQPPG